MKLVMAAFWVDDDNLDAAMKAVASDPVPGIPGSGAVVSFTIETVDSTDFRRTLARFDLDEAAYWSGSLGR